MFSRRVWGGMALGWWGFLRSPGWAWLGWVGGGVYPGLAGVTLWAALARMPSPTRVCCRPRSSRSTPCLSPGWPYPTSPVSRGLGSRWPGLPPGLGTLKDDGDIPSPFQDLVLRGGGRTPSVPGAVSVVLSAACCRRDLSGWLCVCLSLGCPSEPILWAPWLQTWPAWAEGAHAPIPRPEMQPHPADPLGQWDGPGRPRGLRDPVVGRTEHRGSHRLHPVHPLHQVGWGAGFWEGIMIGSPEAQVTGGCGRWDTKLEGAPTGSTPSPGTVLAGKLSPSEGTE